MLVTKVSFDTSESSSAEDGDNVFQKYSSTPPTRSFKMKRKEPRALNPVHSKTSTMYTLDLDNKPAKDGKLRASPSHKWQQKETSLQRSSDRRMKWDHSIDAGLGSQGMFTTDVSSSDDDSLGEKSPNQRIKVISLTNSAHLKTLKRVSFAPARCRWRAGIVL